jgi:hypothetical protein
VTVPVPAAAPPQTVAGPGESADVETRHPRQAAAKPPRPPTDFDHLAEEIEERRHRRHEVEAMEDAAEADRVGAVSLMVGAVAASCLLLGCFTCGLTYWVAAPIAAGGAVCAVFSHSKLRVVGLVLNLLVMIPAVMAFRAAWLVATAPMPEAQPFVR